MNVFIASSWKQRTRVRALAVSLRSAGHEVYDFTDPACREQPEIPPERFPDAFDPVHHVYREYIQAVPEWRGAIEGNRRALERCDLVVLLLPAGNDAHSDWAYAVGAGKRSLVVGHPNAGDRTPSHMWASDGFVDSDNLVAKALGERKEGGNG